MPLTRNGEWFTYSSGAFPVGSVLAVHTFTVFWDKILGVGTVGCCDLPAFYSSPKHDCQVQVTLGTFGTIHRLFLEGEDALDFMRSVVEPGRDGGRVVNAAI
jgi:hypothetical protein